MQQWQIRTMCSYRVNGMLQGMAEFSMLICACHICCNERKVLAAKKKTDLFSFGPTVHGRQQRFFPVFVNFFHLSYKNVNYTVPFAFKRSTMSVKNAKGNR